jgi:type II secretory pathway component PulM
MKAVTEQLAQLKQHPQAPLIAAVVGASIALLLVMNWWHWQAQAVQQQSQSQAQLTQLQAIISQLPSTAAMITDTDAMMTHVSRHPLPASLQGKVSDIRIVNDQLKAQVNQVPAVALFTWLDELTNAGLLVNKMDLTRDDLGVVSGTIIWGGL